MYYFVVKYRLLFVSENIRTHTHQRHLFIKIEIYTYKLFELTIIAIYHIYNMRQYVLPQKMLQGKDNATKCTAACDGMYYRTPRKLRSSTSVGSLGAIAEVDKMHEKDYKEIYKKKNP